MTPEQRRALIQRLAKQLTVTAASTGWGHDIDWIASDRDDHLAFFGTAGLGAIPARVARDPAGLVAVIEEIEKLKGFGFEKSLQEPARAGAFAFDYAGDEHPGQYIAGRAYQRVGKNPAEPLSVALFPAEASDYLRDVRFTSLCFGESTGVIVEDAFAEIYRPTDWDQWSRPELLRPVAPRPKPPADEPPGGPV